MWNIFKKSKDVSKSLVNKLLYSLFNNWAWNSNCPSIDHDATKYLQEGYALNGGVYGLFEKVYNMGMRAPLKLYRKNKEGKNEEITEHELLDLVKKPNTHLKYRELYQGYTIYKLALGNFYLYTPRLENGVNKGKSTELYVMPAQNVEILPGDWMNPIKGYKLEADAEQTEFEPFEILHIKNFNPFFTDNKLYGFSPMKAAARIVAKSNKGHETQQQIFENPLPKALISRKDDKSPMAQKGWNKEQKKTVEDEIKARGNMLMAIGFPVDLQSIGFNPSDLAILETNKEAQKELCNIWCFPYVLMGGDASDYGNTYREAKKEAWQTCLINHNDAFADGLNDFLIAPVDAYSDLFFAFDYSGIEELQDDIHKNIDTMVKANCSINEKRQVLGLDPYDNEKANEPVMTNNQQSFEDFTLSIDEPTNTEDYDESTEEKD